MRRGNIALLAGVLLVCGAQANILIDDFTSGFNSASTSTGFYYDTVAVAAQGGHRYVDHRFDANPLNRPILTDVNAGVPGHMFIEAGSGVDGQSFVVWAGRINNVPNSGPGVVSRGDFAGIAGSLDLTSELGIQVDYINNDQSSTEIYIEVWDSNFNVNSALFVPVAAGNGSYFAAFSNFVIFQGTGVDYSDIRGIAVGLDLPTGNDITLTRVEAVPEPATMTILGLGIAGIAAQRRRKA